MKRGFYLKSGMDLHCDITHSWDVRRVPGEIINLNYLARTDFGSGHPSLKTIKPPVSQRVERLVCRSNMLVDWLID